MTGVVDYYVPGARPANSSTLRPVSGGDCDILIIHQRYDQILSQRYKIINAKQTHGCRRNTTIPIGEPRCLVGSGEAGKTTRTLVHAPSIKRATKEWCMGVLKYNVDNLYTATAILYPLRPHANKLGISTLHADAYSSMTEANFSFIFCINSSYCKRMLAWSPADDIE